MPSRRKRTSPLTALLVALAVVVVLAAALLRAPLSGALWRVLAPIVALRDSFGGGEVAALNAQLASTSAALADYDRLKEQNEALRAQLGRADAARPEVAAAVLTRPPGTPYDTLVLDAGAHQGVAVGQRVVMGALVLGIIDEVYPDSSRAALYSSPGQSYDAVLTTAGGAVPVTIEGQGAGSMSARVPSGTAVAVGDRVEFPGLSGGMVGSITAIEGADTSTFKTIYLHLPVNLFALQYVYIQQ